MTDTVSPATQYEITERHLEAVQFAAFQPRHFTEVREVFDLVKSVSSGGTHALFDKRTQVVVERSELEAMQEQIADVWLCIDKPRRVDALEKIDNTVARWMGER